MAHWCNKSSGDSLTIVNNRKKGSLWYWYWIFYWYLYGWLSANTSKHTTQWKCNICPNKWLAWFIQVSFEFTTSRFTRVWPAIPSTTYNDLPYLAKSHLQSKHTPYNHHFCCLNLAETFIHPFISAYSYNFHLECSFAHHFTFVCLLGVCLPVLRCSHQAGSHYGGNWFWF